MASAAATRETVVISDDDEMSTPQLWIVIPETPPAETGLSEHAKKRKRENDETESVTCDNSPVDPPLDSSRGAEIPDVSTVDCTPSHEEARGPSVYNTTDVVSRIERASREIADHKRVRSTRAPVHKCPSAPGQLPPDDDDDL